MGSGTRGSLEGSSERDPAYLSYRRDRVKSWRGCGRIGSRSDGVVARKPGRETKLREKRDLRGMMAPITALA
jgi:hypothetical protein